MGVIRLAQMWLAPEFGVRAPELTGVIRLAPNVAGTGVLVNIMLQIGDDPTNPETYLWALLGAAILKGRGPKGSGKPSKFGSKSISQPTKPGRIGAEVADDFASGWRRLTVDDVPLPKIERLKFTGQRATGRVLTEDTMFYRVSGGKGGRQGTYLTGVRPESAEKAIQTLALDQKIVGNTAAHLAEVKLPKGTVIWEGTAARLGTKPRGVIQHLCDDFARRPVAFEFNDGQVAVRVHRQEVDELSVVGRDLPPDQHQVRSDDRQVFAQVVFQARLGVHRDCLDTLQVLAEFPNSDFNGHGGCSLLFVDFLFKPPTVQAANEKRRPTSNTVTDRPGITSTESR